MKVVIGCDHAGLAMKDALIDRVLTDYEIIDLGTDSPTPVDYPDIARKVADAVVTGRAEQGILICGTGIGMAMAAGKVSGIRAATCTDPYSAELSRSHNNANILCLGARIVGLGLAEKIVATWLSTPFARGRHTRRIEKIEQ
ncbi:ribose 5-phosphate isomerase B [Candidatus Bipolaricaulota bacterium]|nr:ribose 5-phosphate isomerase B [Candidatus Bipolaricaulota bacterium]